MAALLAAWQTPPPPRPHPARSSLELPLQPLPAAGLLARCYLLLLCLYAAQLLASGHWVMAVVMLLLATFTRLALLQMAPQGPDASRRLLMAADGRLHVACVGGAMERVELAGESLWLGSAVLLVLRTPRRRHRVLLGCGNLDPGALATLRRRLRGATPAPEGPGVDSRASHRHGVSTVEQFTRGNPA